MSFGGGRLRVAALALALGGAGALASGGAGCSMLLATDEAPPEPINECTLCHGTAERDGPAEQRAAPPFDLDGNVETTFAGVGAHEVHLTASATHASVKCVECHVVPFEYLSPGHADSARPAEFVAGTVARSGGRSPRYDPDAGTCSETYCHRDARPWWTSPRNSTAACGSCHGLPPAAPHDPSVRCLDCHGDVIGDNLVFVDPTLHVNGGVDVQGECYDCHGTEDSFAPPPDLDGATAVSAIGVGAHQAHLGGGTNSRPVPCEACHQVPEMVGSIGHIDGTDHAELSFSEIAVTDDRQPVWDRDALRCAQSWCHGPEGAATSSSPQWTTDLGGVPLACDSCHGLPPADPHVPIDDCTICHSDVVEGLPGSITVHNRELHVNGVADL